MNNYVTCSLGAIVWPLSVVTLKNFSQKGKDVHKYYQILKMKTILDLQVFTIFKSLKFNHSRFP